MPVPKVLVVGSGGREHALVRALARSPQAPELHAAPGNPGIAELATLHAVGAHDVVALVALARSLAVSLVVVGPEVPLAGGIADALARAGIACFGPSAAAARLESSKAFCKDVLAAAGIPTAAHRVVTDVEAGMAAVAGRYPTVIKADGLAAGKGVIIAADAKEARAALEAFLVERRFDTSQVVVEECLVGRECSLFALCDGVRALPLPSAQDYKRIGDGDSGPNTGGMGAYSPMPSIGPTQAAEICARVHQPLVDEMARRGTPFHGLLYAGLMLTAEGVKVIEFNVRFGDPETQALLPRLRSDLLALLQATVAPGGLVGVEPLWDDRASVTLVLASAGYPESSSDPVVIRGLDTLPDGIEVTHAGTRWDPVSGALLTAGGRVLNLTALGSDIAAARAAAYAAAAHVAFPGAQLRGDIAAGELSR
ncbi:MAG TPA: phosphoribosylamine--glycine ligase [Solirubrobacteraceae bacterium]|nr:phosphoribosylamine--glycine ligase [Solirubrobacteraceae bacterium]